jgi:hypothetical protein
MITKAFIQGHKNGHLREEELRVIHELNLRQIPITYYTEKLIHRRQLLLDSESLVVGDIPCVLGALKQLSIPEPQPNDYPDSLNKFLHRRIWRSSLSELELELRGIRFPPTFIKPEGRRKRFTGCVFESEYDLSKVYGVSRQEKLLCSEVVNWISEYRVYVVNSEIRSIDHYYGDANVQVDIKELQQAIQSLDKAGDSYAGYAIDFGVLDSGQTALVEMNDGFSIGAYNIDSKNYTDMIWARWEELLIQRKNLG